MPYFDKGVDYLLLKIAIVLKNDCNYIEGRHTNDPANGASVPHPWVTNFLVYINEQFVMVVNIYKDKLLIRFYILFFHSFVSFFGLGAVSAAVMSSAGQLVKL